MPKNARTRSPEHPMTGPEAVSTSSSIHEVYHSVTDLSFIPGTRFLPVHQHVLEGHPAVDFGVFRKPEDALADDVSLHLGRAAGDRERGGMDERAHRLAGVVVTLEPRGASHLQKVEAHARRAANELRAGELGDRAFGTGRVTRLDGGAHPKRHEAQHLLTDVNVYQRLAHNQMS